MCVSPFQETPPTTNLFLRRLKVNLSQFNNVANRNDIMECWSHILLNHHILVTSFQLCRQHSIVLSKTISKLCWQHHCQHNFENLFQRRVLEMLATHVDNNHYLIQMLLKDGFTSDQHCWRSPSWTMFRNVVLPTILIQNFSFLPFRCNCWRLNDNFKWKLSSKVDNIYAFILMACWSERK